MEELSLTTFWLSLGFTAGAVLFYWGYAFGARIPLRRPVANGEGGGDSGAGFPDGAVHVFCREPVGIRLALLRGRVRNLDIAMGACYPFSLASGS